MSAVVLAVADHDTNAASGNTRAVPAFTPAVGDLLVLVLGASGIGGAFFPVITCDNGISFSFVAGAVPRMDVYIADQLVSAAVAHNITLDYTGDPTTGQNAQVLRVSGMTRTGISAIRQILNTDNGVSGTAPAVTLAAACLTSNPTIFAARAAIAAPFFSEPASWTELDDNGFTTPTASQAVCSRDSGYTGSSFTAGATVAASWSAIAIEFDSSASVEDEGSAVAIGVARGVAVGVS